MAGLNLGQAIQGMLAGKIITIVGRGHKYRIKDNILQFKYSNSDSSPWYHAPDGKYLDKEFNMQFEKETISVPKEEWDALKKRLDELEKGAQ